MELFFSVFFYLSFFILVATLLYFGEKYHKKWCIIIGLTIIILVSAFRYKTGIDYVNYENIQSELAKLSPSDFLSSSLSNQYELGLYIIAFISNIFHMDHVLFFGLYSALGILFYYFGLKKCISSKYIWLGILLYMLLFFAPSLNGMRQFSAISIVFFATVSFLINTTRRKRLLIFVVLILFASLVHSSSILFIFMPILIRLNNELSKKSPSQIITWISLGFLFVVVGEFFIINNISVFPILNKYSFYLSWSIEDAPIPNLIPKIIPLLVSIFILIKSKTNRYMIFYYICIVLALATSLIGLLIPYGYRLSDYFFIFQIPFYINFLYNIPMKDRKKIVLYALIMYGLIYFIYSSGINNSHGIIPYQLLPFFN